MILLLDIGNSRIKWALWRENAWFGQGAFARGDMDELERLVAAHGPAWIGISNVAGDAMRVAVERILAGRPVFWAHASASGHGIANHYQPPESLGTDRYLALVACHAHRAGATVVVSAGTALTVDAMTGKGEYLGGVVLPGSALMRSALLEGTAGVSSVSGVVTGFPRCTGDGVETGIWLACAGVVEAVRERLSVQEGTPARVVLAGGDAEELAEMLRPPYIIERNLVLEGLLWLARDMGVSGA